MDGGGKHITGFDGSNRANLQRVKRFSADFLQEDVLKPAKQSRRKKKTLLRTGNHYRPPEKG